MRAHGFEFINGKMTLPCVVDLFFVSFPPFFFFFFFFLFYCLVVCFERGGIRTRVSLRSSDQKSDPFDRARAPALDVKERKRIKVEEEEEPVVERRRGGHSGSF